MLAKADSEHSRSAGTDFDRHLQTLSRFVEMARQMDEGREHCLTLILRSAASMPAQALLAIGDDAVRAGIRCRIILAKLEPAEDFHQLATLIANMKPAAPASKIVRWARNPRLLDAHEQAIYGEVCWVGDAMRREADRRNALSLFTENAPEKLRLAEMAFTALWHASIAVPKARLAERPAADAASKLFNAFAPGAVEPSMAQADLPAWPLIRH